METDATALKRGGRMQIVIEIPEENYQVTLTKIMLACRGCSIIELPKGHGRLIDADAIPGDSSWDFADRLDGTPTIIEVDERMRRDGR